MHSCISGTHFQALQRTKKSKSTCLAPNRRPPQHKQPLRRNIEISNIILCQFTSHIKRNSVYGY
jgi:hypothetical protein